MVAVTIATPTRSRGRAGLVNLVIGLLLLVLIVPLAMHINQNPPPVVAEFAPRAEQTIKDTPPDQTSKVGNPNGKNGVGAGQGSGGGGATPSPSPQPSTAQAAIDVQAVKHCVGNPPRQIEDPQSPPCIPYWKGDNGGATSMGVTGSQILVAHALGSNATEDTGSGTSPQDEQDLLSFFNSRFQLYQRAVKFTDFNPSAQSTGTTAMDQDAAAVSALHPFAEIGYSDWAEGRGEYFYDGLARQHIVSINTSITDEVMDGERHFSKYAPFEWSYLLQPDAMATAFVGLICDNLTGKLASHGGPDVVTQKRKFGVLVAQYSDGTVHFDPSSLINGLQQCGAPFETKSFDAAASPQDTTPTVAQMRTDGVTTILCYCDSGPMMEDFMEPASKMGYHPEWLAGVVQDQSYDESAFAMADVWAPDEAPYVFGLRYYNKSQPAADYPPFWAGRSVDPAFSINGTEDALYHNMLVLFSGIQMAGPRLTPETFQAGLFNTRFPNPGADAAPYWQARVGFENHQHTMTDTVAPVWLSVTQPSVESPPSQVSFCYIDQGARLAPTGDWSKLGDLDKRFFAAGACR